MEIKSDKELIKNCLNGNPEAWSEFVDRFSGLVYWAIKRKLSRYYSAYLTNDADDIYQRLFASLWEKRSLETVSDRDNIAPWLIVLASNLAVDFMRKKKYEEDFLRSGLENGPPPADGKSLLFAKEKRDLLDDAMRALNEKERSYIKLSYIAGKKHKEIAEILNVPANSVSTVIARAKGKIKKFIELKDKSLKENRCSKRIYR